METTEEREERRRLVVVQILRRALGSKSLLVASQEISDSTGISISPEALRTAIAGRPGPKLYRIAEAIIGDAIDSVKVERPGRFVDREERTPLMTAMFAAARAGGVSEEQIDEARRRIPESRAREPSSEQIAEAIYDARQPSRPKKTTERVDVAPVVELPKKKGKIR